MAVWLNEAEAPVSAAVAEAVATAARSLAGAGAIVDDNARPDFDFFEAFEVYALMNHAIALSAVPEKARQRLAAPRQLRPQIDLEMRRFAHANHRAEHNGPDEHEARHLLGPDVGRDQFGVARENLQTDRNDEQSDGDRHQRGQKLCIQPRQPAPQPRRLGCGHISHGITRSGENRGRERLPAAANLV